MKEAKQHIRNISESDFPHSGTVNKQLKFLLRYAVLAPSNHNTQPWKFHIEQGNMDIILDKEKALRFIDPELRQLTISCGAAIGTLEVAAKYFGFELNVKLASGDCGPQVIASITLGKEYKAKTHDIRLFKAITKRQTNRRFFTQKPVPENLLDECLGLAANCAVKFNYITQLHEKTEIAHLVEVAVRQQYSLPWYRREFSSRFRTNNSKKTGMSSFGFSNINLPTPISRLILDLFNTGKSAAMFNHRKICDGSPAIAIFSTEQDGKIDWINTGRVLSVILLDLCAHGFTASYLNQAIEVDNLRPQLAKITHDKGFPQLMIRIGQAKRVKASKRLDMNDVLVV